MERGTPVGWFALLTAVVALAFGVAALVSALDSDGPRFGLEPSVAAPVFGDDAGFPRSGVPGRDGLRPGLPTPEDRSESLPDTDVPRAQLGVRVEATDEGLVVIAVGDTSAADEGGIEVRDVITAIAGEEVSTPEEAERIVEQLEVGESINVEFLRGGESHTAEVEPDLSSDRRASANGRFELPFNPGDAFDLGDGREALAGLLERFRQGFGEEFDFGLDGEFGNIQIVTGTLSHVDDDSVGIETASGTVEFTIDDDTLILRGADTLTPDQDVLVVATDGVARILRQPLSSFEDETIFTG